ncbi:MAG: SBBP repeat-containing protein, partial [Nitrospiraceae bacterium]
MLSWATYLGGSADDDGSRIAMDQAGNAYVTGGTRFGSDFPGTATSLIQSMPGSGSDVFVTKLNPAGTALLYSTYIGGSGDEGGVAIAVDQAGNAYVTGTTNTPASGFPGTAGSSIQSTYGGGFSAAFVTKLNAAGTALVYSTYLGGINGDSGYGIAVDAAGNAYVTGQTYGPFPGTAGSLIQNTIGGASDAFVTKINAAGTALVYSTYLGGSGKEQGNGIAVDLAGNAYVTGTTDTPGSGFPGTLRSLIQSTNAGGGDAFITKLNAAGTALVYSTYLGGSGEDHGNGIAVDQMGNVYVTGGTWGTYSGDSGDFPGTADSLIQSTISSRLDAFVAKITSAMIINDLVTLVPLAATYRTTSDSTGCPSGFVGKFGFDARLTNENSSPPLSDLAGKVKTLSNGNLLQNADGGNGGVGS